MAEIGFPVFFTLMLLAGICALAATVAAHWSRIVAALDGDLIAGPSPERILSVRTCAPADLPYVARRMDRAAVSEPARPAPGRRKAA
ncbi:hypothetical protein [Sphingosinicella sp. BN140058]|uniref:hypothetical protein n=1 Tax=Sphingosinicella sp. BN140058 TaxID=1892855 RepID=UPI0010101E43|nr:hypothetical protein [Sphingosinicella sp. BN140058]QAY75731.1 hypothetical protein ETR14_03705 [Sphingosinicella sp. BN140058]